MKQASQDKIQTVDFIKAQTQERTLFFTDFKSVSVNEMNSLRKKLKDNGAELKVVKNTLIMRALKELGISFGVETFQGPTALVVSGEDPAQTAKIIIEFLKEKENVNVKGGVLDQITIAQDQVVELSQLPSREELVAKLVMILASPLTGLVRVLSAPTQEFSYILKTISERQEDN